jgi:hypothetical protein
MEARASVRDCGGFPSVLIAKHVLSTSALVLTSSNAGLAS